MIRIIAFFDRIARDSGIFFVDAIVISCKIFDVSLL